MVREYRACRAERKSRYFKCCGCSRFDYYSGIPNFSSTRSRELRAIIISDPLTVGYANDDYVYSLRAIDPDSDELTYSLVNAPDAMTVDPLTGELTWNDLTEENIGVHDITVEVQDNRGGVDSQTFQLTIGNDASLGEIRGIKWLESN